MASSRKQRAGARMNGPGNVQTPGQIIGGFDDTGPTGNSSQGARLAAAEVSPRPELLFCFSPSAIYNAPEEHLVRLSGRNANAVVNAFPARSVRLDTRVDGNGRSRSGRAGSTSTRAGASACCHRHRAGFLQLSTKPPSRFGDD